MIKLSQIGYSEFFMPPEADEFLDQVKQEFSESLLVDDNSLSEWLKHHGDSEGKWIRARLALASGALLGLDSQTYIKWAVVCELIHSASLLHDDICDEDLLRRGRRTVWKKFGIPAAICSGDYLIAESFRKITEIEQGWHQTILLKLLSTSVKEIVFGQSMDVSVNPFSLSWNEYKKIAYEKTSPLISMPVMGMFQCKEIKGDECDALIEISNDLGLAYQWLNDIENVIGLEQEKFSDLFNGHPNAVIVHHLSKQPNSNIKTFKDIKKLENLINSVDLNDDFNEVKNILNVLEKKVHRIPVIIQPILIALKQNIEKRLKKNEKN